MDACGINPPIGHSLSCLPRLHLAYRVFKDSVMFPFVLALFGLGLILSTVWAQRKWLRSP
jgi:hypothetical protein